MVIDFRDPQEFRYEYFKEERSSGIPDQPIRKVYRTKTDMTVGADTIMRETGALFFDPDLLSFIGQSANVVRSTEQEFYALCVEIINLQKKGPAHGLK